MKIHRLNVMSLTTDINRRNVWHSICFCQNFGTAIVKTTERWDRVTCGNCLKHRKPLPSKGEGLEGGGK